MARNPSRRSGNESPGVAEANGGGSAPPPSPPELVIVARADAALRASAGRLEALSGEPTESLATLLADHGAALRPLFGATEERVAAFGTSTADPFAPPGEPIDLTTFYAVDAPVARQAALQSDLLGHDLVEGAYIKPGAEPPAFLNDMAPAPQEAPPVSPDFGARQLYLDAAPGGIEARWAWTQAGGRGAGIRIIDVEGAWRFTHEDLTGNQGGVVGGTPSSDIGWRNHGTAVIGEFSGDANGFGITGIAADATVSAISIFGASSSSAAINAAAARLGPGDVILIELHRPGPRFQFANRNDQRGYIAVEWWPDDFAAIRNAVNRGIIVVEAGGNGAENLDDALYQTAATGFPASWTNPFRRSNRDSGAIVVGAGAPPPGTHGRNHGADRSRLDFSNWGALVDTQGWGREVTTCAYGDLQGGTNEDLWYTDTFSGTSSASPIIVGVAASLQGMARARGHAPLTPAQFRACLRSTGSQQQDEPGRPATQRIGTRPNLRQLAVCAFGKGKEIAKEAAKEIAKEVVKEGKEFAKERKDAVKEFKEVRKETKELAKEVKELKERPEKQQIKEVKEKDKDKDKDLVEGGLGGIRDRTNPQLVGGGPGGPSDLEERIASIESALQGLIHFIGSDLRPDMSVSALGGYAQGDEQAKSSKDQKDTEGF